MTRRMMRGLGPDSYSLRIQKTDVDTLQPKDVEPAMPELTKVVHEWVVARAQNMLTLWELDEEKCGKEIPEYTMDLCWPNASCSVIFVRISLWKPQKVVSQMTRGFAHI